MVSRIGHQAADCVELVVARKDEALLSRLSALVILFLDHLDEVLDQVQHAVA